MTSVDFPPITDLLLAWQSSGSSEDLTKLVAFVRPLIEKRAAAILRRFGIRSPAAVDDVVSLVLDHLRRLHSSDGTASAVAPFKAAAAPIASEQAGHRYVMWLTKSRARDVVRSERRRYRKAPSFTDVFSPRRAADGRSSIPRLLAVGHAVDDDPDADRTAAKSSVMGCIGSLPDEQRRIVEMLLAGTPQKTIARALGISEGTISRRKARAFATLRHHLRESRRLGTTPRTAVRPRAVASDQPAEAACLGADAPPFVVFLSTASQPVEVRRSCNWHLFGLVTRGLVRSTWLSEPSQPSADSRSGTCGYFPPGGDNLFRLEPQRPTAVLQVAVAPDFFRMVADSEERQLSDALHGDHCFEDPTLSTMLRRFEHRAGGSTDSLAADLDGHALVMRLLELQGFERPEWQLDSSRFTVREVKSLSDYVQENLETAFRLRQLADLVGLSPGHFARKFRESFGVSPAEFVKARRVREAARLLLLEDLPIAVIAQRVGFSSQSQFARFFRSIVGTSPAGFRAECS